MKFYVLLDNQNTIRDIIEYPHEGYQEIDLALPLPIGICGGWFKLENGKVVEYPELKPINKDEQIEALKEQIALQDGAILELAELLGGLLDG